MLLKTIDGRTMLIIYRSRSLEYEVTFKLNFLSSLSKSCGPTEVFSVFNFLVKLIRRVIGGNSNSMNPGTGIFFLICICIKLRFLDS